MSTGTAVPAVGAPARTGGDRLQVVDATVTFGGITALDSVSVEVNAGEVVGVIGPNGAGKTTLFNVICGFVKPDSGTIRWKGEALKQVRPQNLAKLGIARTLQGVGLFEDLTVLENVMVGAHRFSRAPLITSIFGLPTSDRDERRLKERAMTYLRELDCVEAADRKPGELPYPISKRVALARALVAEPDLLLLDEPAGGLGEDDLKSLTQMIRRLSDRCSVMLVEHHMDLVMAACDRIFVLDFGKLIASGTPAQIANDPAVLDAYLGRPVEASADGEQVLDA
jgi:branched-chain amino acid transport system ATP-binding protein